MGTLKANVGQQIPTPKIQLMGWLMLRSFIDSDIYRVMLGGVQQEMLLTLLARLGVPHDGNLRAMARDHAPTLHVTVLFVEGDVLQRLSLSEGVELIQVDNISARLRAVPPLPSMRQQAAGSIGHARVREFGQAA